MARVEIRKKTPVPLEPRLLHCVSARAAITRKLSAGIPNVLTSEVWEVGGTGGAGIATTVRSRASESLGGRLKARKPGRWCVRTRVSSRVVSFMVTDIERYLTTDS